MSPARKASDDSDQKKASASKKRSPSSKTESSSAKQGARKKAAPKKRASKQASAKKPPAKKAAAKGSPAKSASTKKTPAEETAPAESSAPVVEDAAVVHIPFDRIVAFHLGGQRYAVPIDAVQEIQQIVAFSEVPASGGAVVGMVNLRGTVIPALDARTLIGLEPEEFHVDTPMIICRTRGQLVALIVDRVEDVLSVPPDCLQAPPSMHDLASRLIGVCHLDDDLVYVFDIESLVAPVDVEAR